MGESMDNSYREKIFDVISKTENYFEEKITYISAGSLVLSLTFIEKIIPLGDAFAVIFLVIGWALLVLTLLLNLSSHMISKCLLNKTLLEIDKNADPNKLRLIYLNVIKRNKRIDCINWFSVVLLFLGVLSIVIFASINSFQKASMKCESDQLKKVTLQSLDSTINKSQTKIYYYYGTNNK